VFYNCYLIDYQLNYTAKPDQAIKSLARSFRKEGDLSKAYTNPRSVTPIPIQKPKEYSKLPEKSVSVEKTANI